MSNVAPGRPRRQQQVYRRANTSGNLITGSGLDNINLEDPYVGCSSIVDKFIGSAASSSGYESSTLPVGSGVMNGGGGSVGSSRKSSSSGGGALKEFLMGRNNNPKDLGYSSHSSGMSDTTVTADSLPIYSGAGNRNINNWAIQDQSVINDLTLGPPRQQPKYSYLVGRTNTSSDLWRKPASNTSFSHVNSFQPPPPSIVPLPPPPLPTSSLPLQNSQSTSYVGGPYPSSSSRYGHNTYNPKRSSQLYENYEQFANTSGSAVTGNKRNINTSIGTDYQMPPPPPPPSHHSQMYNEPPPSSFSSNNNDLNIANIKNNNSSVSAALSYEDRINTALGRKVPKSSTTSTIASNQNVQKSKSYSNFASVRTDLALQVLNLIESTITDPLTK